MGAQHNQATPGSWTHQDTPVPTLLLHRGVESEMKTLWGKLLCKLGIHHYVNPRICSHGTTYHPLGYDVTNYAYQSKRSRCGHIVYDPIPEESGL